MKTAATLSLISLGLANAFAPIPTQQRQSTQLQFGIPTFGAGKDKKEATAPSDSNEPKKKIDLSGLVQLITAGMGSPFLGNFEGVEKDTGKMMFSLEANNLVDEDGESKQTKMPYFESGWVDEADLEKEKQKKANGGFKFW